MRITTSNLILDDTTTTTVTLTLSNWFLMGCCSSVHTLLHQINELHDFFRFTVSPLFSGSELEFEQREKSYVRTKEK